MPKNSQERNWNDVLASYQLLPGRAMDVGSILHLRLRDDSRRNFFPMTREPEIQVTTHAYKAAEDLFSCAICRLPRAVHAYQGFQPGGCPHVCMDPSVRYGFDKKQAIVPGRRRGWPLDPDEYRPVK